MAGKVNYGIINTVGAGFSQKKEMNAWKNGRKGVERALRGEDKIACCGQ